MKKNYLIIGGVALMLAATTACKKDEPKPEDPLNEDPTTENPADEDPIVGDEMLVPINFSSSVPLATSTNNYEYPSVFDGGVLWAASPNPTSLRCVEVDGGLSAIGSDYEVVSSTGTLSGPNDIDVKAIKESQTGSIITAFNYAQSGEYGMKFKEFTHVDQSIAEAYIEGPFQYANERPRYPEMADNGNGTIGVVYHSSSGTSTPSSIRFKTIDVAGGVTVSPVPSVTQQNGTVISGGDADALFPQISWNANQNAYGVVYMVGSGNNRSIRFVKVDASGSVLAGPVTVTSGAGFETQNPRIATDGNNFVVTWRDFRTVQIGDAEPVQGVPAIRLAVIDGNGSTQTFGGAADIYDASDNSLLLTNPYETEAGMYHEVVVKSTGQKYGVVSATQTSPYQLYFVEVHNDGATLKGTVQSNISSSSLSEDRLDLRVSNGEYQLVFTGQKTGGTGYEIRKMTEQ